MKYFIKEYSFNLSSNPDRMASHNHDNELRKNGTTFIRGLHKRVSNVGRYIRVWYFLSK